MPRLLFLKTTGLVIVLLFLGSFNLSAQEDTVLVTAAGFGGTREKALDQASMHAVIITAEKNFASMKAFAAIEKEVLQYIKDNYTDFVDDLSNVTVIKKYKRNKIRARIPVKKAELISAVQNQFPDLEQ